MKREVVRYGGPTVDELFDQAESDARLAAEAATAQAEADARRAAAVVRPAVADSPARALEGRTASLAWWVAIAECETGHRPATDEWRTGYFGLEAGHPVGGMGWDAELEWAKRILADVGPVAWGCTWTVGAPY